MGAKMKLAKKLAGSAAKSIPGVGTVLSAIETVKTAKDAFTGNKTRKPKPGEPGYRKVRRRGILYYLKKIPVEKAKARLQRIKLSAYKGL